MATGIGNMLGVNYLPDGQVRFVFDQRSQSPILGPPLKIQPGQVYVVDVVLDRAHGRVTCKLDEQMALEVAVPPDTFTSNQISFGANPLRDTMIGPLFSGTLTRMTASSPQSIVSHGQLVQQP